MGECVKQLVQSYRKTYNVFGSACNLWTNAIEIQTSHSVRMLLFFVQYSKYFLNLLHINKLIAEETIAVYSHINLK